MTVRLMKDRELRRLEMLQDLDRRKLTAAAAARRRLPNVPSHSRELGWFRARLPFELRNKSPRLAFQGRESAARAWRSTESLTGNK